MYSVILKTALNTELRPDSTAVFESLPEAYSFFVEKTVSLIYDNDPSYLINYINEHDRFAEPKNRDDIIIWMKRYTSVSNAAMSVISDWCSRNDHAHINRDAAETPVFEPGICITYIDENNISSISCENTAIN
jgi:hypothetical protein